MPLRPSRLAVAVLLMPLVACAVGSTDEGGPGSAGSPILDAAPGVADGGGAAEGPGPASGDASSSPSIPSPTSSPGADAAPSAEDASAAPAPTPAPVPTPSPVIDASTPPTPPPAQLDAGVTHATCVAEGTTARCTACSKCTNGCSCQPNGCYNHYFCDSTNDRCIKACP